MDINALVVEDFPIVREAIAAALASDPAIHVVGQAADGHEGLALAREHRPDVVLLDLRLPGLDGITVLRRLTEELPQTRVLVMTASESGDLLLEAAAAGAAGYLTKRISRRELVDAVITVHGGRSIVAPEMVGHLARACVTPIRINAFFTPRELDVVRCVIDGLTDEEIGVRLALSPRTVQSYLMQIREKTGQRRRPQIVRWAMEHDIGARSNDAAAVGA